MSTKHTPGPWHWYGARSQRHLHDSNSNSFAQVSMPNSAAYHADAKLIAAAPEMAEALRKIAFEPFGAAEASDRQVLDAITELARAALAKAAL